MFKRSSYILFFLIVVIYHNARAYSGICNELFSPAEKIISFDDVKVGDYLILIVRDTTLEVTFAQTGTVTDLSLDKTVVYLNGIPHSVSRTIVVKKVPKFPKPKIDDFIEVTYVNSDGMFRKARGTVKNIVKKPNAEGVVSDHLVINTTRTLHFIDTLSISELTIRDLSRP